MPHIPPPVRVCIAMMVVASPVAIPSVTVKSPPVAVATLTRGVVVAVVAGRGEASAPVWSRGLMRCRGGSEVLAYLLAVVHVHQPKGWVRRAPVQRNEVVGRVVDPAINIVSILAARADGGGRGGGGKECWGSVTERW